MTKIAPDPSFTVSSLPPEISTKLQRHVEGEVLVDGASRGRYATDASIYQQFPVAVLVPKSAQDIEAALEVANESGIPVLPRGGGTSQCGQTTGAALVIDNSKHFRKILSSDLSDPDHATVEVGFGIRLMSRPLHRPPLAVWQAITRVAAAPLHMAIWYTTF